MDQERLVRQPRDWGFPDPGVFVAITLVGVVGLALDLPWWGTVLVAGGSYGVILLVTGSGQRRRRTRASSQTGSSAS